MSEDDVGYGRPPRHSQFKAGNNANPAGRPKRKPTAVAEIIDGVMNGLAEYREGGQTKKARRRELTVKTHIKLALRGNLKSIETILLLRAHAQTTSDTGVHRFEITDWLPDYPGQTGEQKTREFAAQAKTENLSWWEDMDANPEGKGK